MVTILWISVTFLNYR